MTWDAGNKGKLNKTSVGSDYKHPKSQRKKFARNLQGLGSGSSRYGKKVFYHCIPQISCSEAVLKRSSGGMLRSRLVVPVYICAHGDFGPEVFPGG